MAEALDSDSDQLDRYAKIQAKLKLVNRTFTPMRPVQTREIFAGRTEQLVECFSLVDQIGAQGILYGDRGVGKTSIANMVNILSLTNADPIHVAKIECTSTDTFEAIVRQAYESVPVEVVQNACGFLAPSCMEAETVPLSQLVSEKASFNPKHIALVLKQLKRCMLFILDEFDRLNFDLFNISSFTELLKILSDTDVDAHFLIVGVGDSVEAIIGNHASVVRNIVQINLATMGPEEIRQIVRNGLASLEMEMRDALIERIVDFSCGYPHYTHLLSLHACSNAIRAERSIVEASDLNYAISKALSKAQESVKNSYHAATMANRQNIYK